MRLQLRQDMGVGVFVRHGVLVMCDVVLERNGKEGSRVGKRKEDGGEAHGCCAMTQRSGRRPMDQMAFR